MKRCPQCEFIYEDEQSLCDMDGIALVASSEVLTAALEPERPATKPTKSRAGRFLIMAVAVVVLGLVLILVYSISAQRARMRVAVSSPSLVAANLQPTDAESITRRPLAQPLNHSPAVEAPKSPEVRRTAEPGQIAISDEPEVTKPVPAASQTFTPGLDGKSRPANFNPKPRSMNQKSVENGRAQKGSTFGSILIKAVRILKTPFTH